MLRFLSVVLFCLSAPALAERIPSHCLAFAQREHGPPIRLAATNLAKDEVQLTYLEHSMYRIDTHGGLSVITDYHGGGSPDVVTMNHAHSSHYTNHPDPDIAHVLRGWDPAGGVADHNLELDEMLIRNVTTDIRSRYTGVEPDGNSIFVFEVAGLCIGHLGHLHHQPTDEQYARLGRLDVVMAPVDGGATLALPDMIATLKRLRALVVLPMHWWGRGSLEVFLAGMREDFAILDQRDSSITVSLDTLPRNPTVVVLQPRVYPTFDE